MTKSQGTKKIAILGPYGVGNIGDSAIVEAMIDNIRRRIPDAAIFGININPEDTARRHNIPSFPIHRMHGDGSSSGDDFRTGNVEGIKSYFKRLAEATYPLYAVCKIVYRLPSMCRRIIEETIFVFRSYKKIRGFDIVLVNGSGQLCDLWGGPWLHPYGLLKWGIIARAARVKYAVVSVGAGPIESPISRSFIKYSLRLSNYRSFRNNKSRELVESIGVRGDNLVFPDLAYSLSVEKGLELGHFAASGRIIGINPMAYYDPRCWPKHDSTVYRTYINKLAAIVSRLLSKDYSVLLFSSDRMDGKVIEDITEIMRANGDYIPSRVHHPEISSIHELLSAISLTEAVVATRLHSLLLSSLLYKPLIALSPQPKVDYLMEGLGQNEYCLDINKFDPTLFENLFAKIQANKDVISTVLKERVTKFRCALEQQYERLFALIEE